MWEGVICEVEYSVKGISGKARNRRTDLPERRGIAGQTFRKGGNHPTDFPVRRRIARQTFRKGGGSPDRFSGKAGVRPTDLPER